MGRQPDHVGAVVDVHLPGVGIRFRLRLAASVPACTLLYPGMVRHSTVRPLGSVVLWQPTAAAARVCAAGAGGAVQSHSPWSVLLPLKYMDVERHTAVQLFEFT